MSQRVCPNCKHVLPREGHYVPPSFGDPGFFACEALCDECKRLGESCPVCGYYKRGEDGTCVQCFAEWPHSQHPAPGCLPCEDALAEAREAADEFRPEAP